MVKTEEITLRNTFCPGKRLHFLAEKSHPKLLRGWLRDTGYPIYYYLPLFATIRDCSPLFALFVLFVLFAIRYSGLFAIRVFQTPVFMSLWNALIMQCRGWSIFKRMLRSPSLLTGSNPLFWRGWWRYHKEASAVHYISFVVDGGEYYVHCWVFCYHVITDYIFFKEEKMLVS